MSAAASAAVNTVDTAAANTAAANAAAAAAAAAAAPENPSINQQFDDVLATLKELIEVTDQIKTKLNASPSPPPAEGADVDGSSGGAKSSRRRKLKGGDELSDLMVQKTGLTEQLLKKLTELNAALAPAAKKDGGGAKSRRRARKVAGGSALSAFSPAVYNIQGLLSESHDPANVTRDPAIAAMTQLHAPFSAGVVSATLQSPTADIAPAAIQRITPMVGMQPPITIQAGGAKKARAAKKPRAAKKAA